MQFIAPYRLIPGVGGLDCHFHPLHLADLRKSGLDDFTIREAGLYSLSPDRIGDFFSGSRGATVVSALCFPYTGDFARIKIFPAVDKQKYSQPPGTSARLYKPFPIDDGPIFVPEGEKKGLAAWQHGLNAVSIGGVWSWFSHGRPIDDLAKIPWDGREATIVGDSDIWDRDDLIRAVYALGMEIAAMGAVVDFIELPRGDEGKVGLDDFLAKNGDLEALPRHAIGSRTFARHRNWYQGWKLSKVAQEEGL